MNCSQIVAKIESLEPQASAIEVSRLCTLICSHVQNLNDLNDTEYFQTVWEEVNLRLNAASDQHSAMTAELNDLTNSDPRKFSPDQIWILVRAIKVQSQVLRLYLGESHTELV
jgi:hypothetical protein